MEYAWSTPWYPNPRRLASGLWLMDADSIQAAGMRVGLRLVWLKREGARLRKIGEFEGSTTLDFDQAQVRGSRVTAHTVDGPVSFWVSASTPVFGRLTTWDCSSGRPKLVAVQLLHQALRAIDRAAVAAHRARRPTPLQARIRKLWGYSRDEPQDLQEWTEKRLPGGLTQVVCDSRVAFDLKPGPQGYSVAAVHALPK